MQKAHEIPIESQATAFLQAAGLKQRVLSLESCQHTMGRVPQGPPRGVVETPRGQNCWILLGSLGISLVILEKKT